jgi:hypothetical protein
MTLIKTNTNEFKSRFKNHFEAEFKELTDVYINSVDEFLQAFDNEANFENNKKRIPNLQKRLADWLMGQPYGFSYSYTHEQVELAKLLYQVDELPKQTEKTISENFYNFCALKFMQVASPEIVRKLH